MECLRTLKFLLPVCGWIGKNGLTPSKVEWLEANGLVRLHPSPKGGTRVWLTEAGIEALAKNP